MHYSRQTVMAAASLSHNFRVHTSSIVSNPNPQQPFAIRDLRFDSARLRVAEGIAQCLPGNAVDLVSYGGQRPRQVVGDFRGGA
jgi:hypothetical protein